MKSKIIAFALSACMIIPAFAVTAKIPDATVFVDGEQVEILAYNIGGANYFKLRDLAMALSKTEKRFAVYWNEDTQTVEITTDANYAPIGGELTGNGAIQAEAKESAHKVMVDGVSVALSAYNIGGANYFKLRDVLSEVGAGVTWDDGNRHVLITTKSTVSEDKIAAANAATVSIRAIDDEANISGEGLGIVVSEDGKILTSYNVIKRALSAKATLLKDGAQYNITGIIAYNEKSNLALVKSEIVTDAPATLSESALNEGDACTSIFGYNSFDSGVCKNFREDEYSAGWQTDIAIGKADWGAPVLNAEGELLGIGYSRVWNTSEVGMIAPIDEVKSWLSKTEVTDFDTFLQENYPFLDKKELSDVRMIIHARHPRIAFERGEIGVKGMVLQKDPNYYKRLNYGLYLEDVTLGTYIYEDWFGDNYEETHRILQNYVEKLLDSTANYFPEYEVTGNIFINVCAKDDPGEADEISQKIYDAEKDVWNFRYRIFWFEKTDLTGLRTAQ